jgi:hypothetical protein
LVTGAPNHLPHRHSTNSGIIECENDDNATDRNSITIATRRNVDGDDGVPLAPLVETQQALTARNAGAIAAAAGRRNVYRTMPRRRHGNATAAAATVVAVVRASLAPGRTKSGGGAVALQQTLPVDRGRHQAAEVRRVQPQQALAYKMKAVELPAVLLSKAVDESNDVVNGFSDFRAVRKSGNRVNGDATTSAFPLPEPVSGRSSSLRQRFWPQMPRRQHTMYHLQSPRQPLLLFAAAAGNTNGASNGNGPESMTRRSHTAADIADNSEVKAQAEAFKPETSATTGTETCNVVDLKFDAGRDSVRGGHQQTAGGGGGGGEGGPTIRRQLTVAGLEQTVAGFTTFPPLSTRRSLEH